MVPGAVNGREGFEVLARSMTIIVIKILASHGGVVPLFLSPVPKLAPGLRLFATGAAGDFPEPASAPHCRALAVGCSRNVSPRFPKAWL